MVTAELNEESTTDDIKEYVDELAEAAEADRVEQEKPDAQIVSEHADTHERAASEEAYPEPKETVDTASDGEKKEAGQESTDQDWLDDDMKAEIAAYGIEESELAGFANREDVERVLNLFDSRFKKGEKEETAADEETKDEPAKVKLDPDVYDEEIVKAFDYLNSKIEELESGKAEDAAFAREERFDGIVDTLGAAEIFGKTGSESKKELARRKEVMDDVMLKLEGLKNAGRPAEITEAMVRRSARGIFADEFDKKLLKNQTRKISRQSNGRQGGGATRASDPREDPRDEADRLYKEMEG